MSTSDTFQKTCDKLRSVNADPRIIETMTKMVKDEQTFEKRQKEIHQERDRLKAELDKLLNR